MNNYIDIVECLKNAAMGDKGVTVIKSVDEEILYPYSEVLRRAELFGEHLLNLGVERGDYILIRCSEMTNIMFAFWACALSGCIAVPVIISTKDEIKKELEDGHRKVHIITDILCDNPQMYVNVIDISKFDWETQNNISKIREVKSAADDILYVQFSSGITGASKGIAISKRNVSANLIDQMKCFDVNKDDIVLNWEPLTHSGGLVIFHLMAIMANIHQYLMQETLYVKNPLLWMNMIDKYRATLTGSVPFALRHFMNLYYNSKQKCNWDLSCLKVMTLGAEHVGIDLFNEFRDEMERYGLKKGVVIPTYGLTENTCLLGFGVNDGYLDTYMTEKKELVYGGKVVKAEKTDQIQEYILYKRISDSIDIRITDEDNKVLPLGTIGKLWIKGPSVIDGYLHDGRIVADSHFEEGWFDTGDLGCLVTDRELAIMGRAKEIVISGGVNYECASLEKSVNSIEGMPFVKESVVCNMFGEDGIEQIGVFSVCEIDEEADAFWKQFLEYRDVVRNKLLAEYGVVIMNVIPIEEIPRSGSGKIRRIDLATNYKNGNYTKRVNIMENKTKNIKQPLGKTDVKMGVSGIIKDLLNIEIDDYQRTFQEYGIVSINILELVKRCNEKFNINMMASDLFNYPVIEDFISYILSLVYKDGKEENAMKTYNCKSDDDIVVVGMSCRFPNGANSVSDYWCNLVEHIDGITEVPAERWDKDKYYSADKNEKGKMYCKLGGFLNRPIDEFDAKFFNISPKEAVEIDPHSRILLELTYEAFENGGMNISEYSGSNTGVYVGVSSDDYSLATVSSGDLDKIDSYSLTGVCKSTVCGRISYVFGFEGGCFSVNTACSSALTALHLACISLKNGDVDNAVVGAANLMISPSVTIAFSKLKATSPNGHCRSFDADADGYARGEGAGVLVLKRLSDAKKNHDHILGVVRATGINQDGKSNGLTAPNGESQKKLIIETLKKNNIDPASVGYIEAHGTGTPLGDPIEVNAIIEAYCKGRKENNPLYLGSVKSNIGHLEAASGMASIIKVLLSFQHEMIPANLNFVTPNPQIRWEDAPLKVVNINSKWKKSDSPRRASINSFGFGGSNAHVVLEEYKEEAIKVAEKKESYVLKISSKDDESTAKLAEKYLNKLVETSDEEFNDFLNTANKGRADYASRVAIVGEDKKEIVQGLRGFLQGDTVPGVYNSKDVSKKNKICFMYTGQGSQYIKMGMELYRSSVLFKAKIDECDALFKPYILQSIVDLLYSDTAVDELINATANAQPLIFSIEYAITELWKLYGIRPEMVIGHSIGEYAAAVTAGIMSLNTAVMLVATRGRLMGHMSGNSTMLTVFADEQTTSELLRGKKNTVIAVYNAAENCVVSGDKQEITDISAKATERGIRVRELKVSHGFHSPFMKPAAENFKEIISKETFAAPSIDFISTVYARKLEEGEILNAEYWANQICAQVKFYQAMKNIENPSEVMFVEVGATNTLASLCKLIFNETTSYVATMSRTVGNAIQLNQAIATLYVNGNDIDWNKLGDNDEWRRVVELPNYPFDRKSYWQDLMYDRKASGSAEVVEGSVNSLLGQKIESVYLSDTIIFQKIYRNDKPFFMKEHVIFNTVIAPCASYVSILISAMKEICNPKSISICDMELREPLIVADDEKRLVQVCIINTHSSKCEYKIVSKLVDDAETEWTVHSQGSILVNSNDYFWVEETVDVKEWDAMGYDEIGSEGKEHSVYDAMIRAGFNLGEGFRRVRKTRCKEHNGYCYIDPHNSLDLSEEYTIYPGVVDSVFHTMLCIILADGFKFGERRDITMIPYFIKRINFNYRDFDKLWVHSDSVVENESFIGGSNVYNDKNQLIINIEHMITRLTNENVLITNHRSNSKYFYHYDWKKTTDISVINRDIENVYAILDDENSCLDIRQNLEKQGKKVTLITSDEFEKKVDGMLDAIEVSKKEIVVVYGLGLKYSMNSVDQEVLRKLTILSKKIIERGVETFVSVRILTSNACSFKNAKVNLNGALLWGFSKTMGMELEKAYLGIIDVDNIDEYRDKNKIASMILFAKDYEICVRNNETFISRVSKHSDYVKTNKITTAPIVLSADETYVVAGGTGAVGLNYIRALIESGAKNLAIISRSVVKIAFKETIAELTNNEINVGYFNADICDKEQIKTAIHEIEAKMPRIGGIINATGVIRDKFITDLEWEDYMYVLNPKVTGNLNIYECLVDHSLRFFIMTSSITSILGNMGQSNYAAANYFMNAFAEQLTAEGMNGFAMCWGPWGNGGMTIDKTTQASMEMMGIDIISSEEGISIICEFFKKPMKELVIAKINWEQFVKNLSGNAAKVLLKNLVQADKTVDEKKTEVSLDYTNMSKNELTDELTFRLQRICMKVMGYSDSEGVDIDTSFRELGADSLMMFSIRSELNKLLDKDISVSILYSYETISKLVDYIVDEVICLEVPIEEQTNKSSEQLFSELEALV